MKESPRRRKTWLAHHPWWKCLGTMSEVRGTGFPQIEVQDWACSSVDRVAV